MKIYGTPGYNPYRRYHRLDGCRYSQRDDMIELEHGPTAGEPCGTCFPDAPRFAGKIRKPYCHTCETSRACRHNGGIEVEIEYTVRKHTLLNAPGDKIVRKRWVWPDRVHRYQQVA